MGFFCLQGGIGVLCGVSPSFFRFVLFDEPLEAEVVTMVAAVTATAAIATAALDVDRVPVFVSASDCPPPKGGTDFRTVIAAAYNALAPIQAHSEVNPVCPGIANCSLRQ